MMMKAPPAAGGKEDLPVEGQAPSLAGAVEWLNSPAADDRSAERQGRAGRLLDLLLHQLPARDPLCARLGAEISRPGPRRDRRARAGIRFREDRSTMSRKAIADLKIDYPVAIDNDYAIWRAFENQYWPAHLFHRRRGRACATTISARATTKGPSGLSSSCLPRRAVRKPPRPIRQGERDRRAQAAADRSRRAIAGDLYRL